MKRRILLLGIFILGGILFSCAPKSFPGEKPSTSETLAREVKPVVKEAWQVEWNKTLAEAKKEGRLILFTSAPPSVRDALTQGFRARTGIAPEFVTGRGGEIAQKLLTERRNGLFLADVWLSGIAPNLISIVKPAGALAPIKPVLFLPEVLDLKLWYGNTLPWVDKDQLILQARMMPGGSQADIAFMSSSIDKRDFVSWHDLLKPQLKGRMSLQDPTAGGKGGNWVNKGLTYYGLDWDYFKSLAKLEPFVTRDERLQIEWVVRGKHLLAINPDSDTGDEFKEAGAPLEYAIFKETRDVLGGGSSAVALIDKAPHLNAARLFVNWFLSREGQTYFARSYNVQSARMDTPTDHLPPNKIRQAGVDYPVETEEFHLQQVELRPKIIDIFGPLVR